MSKEFVKSRRSGKCDPVARSLAAKAILNTLRSPLALMSKPSREEALRLARDFNVTALDLLELAIRRARDT
jgi:hypothetical protein